MMDQRIQSMEFIQKLSPTKSNSKNYLEQVLIFEK